MPLNLNVIAQLKAQIVQAVQDEATDSILAPAVADTPKDTGALAASGRVVTDGEQVWVTFGRDDDGEGTHAPTNQYAEIVHENLEARHPNGGHAKFLQTAADNAASGFAERVLGRIGT